MIIAVLILLQASGVTPQASGVRPDIPSPTSQVTSLTVAQAVDRALASHPTIAAARANHDRAIAEAGDARASRRPRLTLDASLTQFQEPMVVLPLHGFDPQNPPLFDRSLVQSGVSFGWTVYDFGQRAARVRVQGALSGAADAAVTTAERQIVARTVLAYVRVLTARGVLAAHDQRITALNAAASRIRQLVTEGKAARVEQLRVDAETQRALADRIGTAAQLGVAEQELAQLTQSPVAAVRGAALSGFRLQASGDSTLAVDTSEATRSTLIARAYRSSSEIQELEWRARAASAGLAATRAIKFPELRATGAFVDRGRLEGDFAGEWQIGMAVSYPLYTGGSRTHLIERAGAEERIAQQQIRVAQLNVESGVDRSLASLREAHARAAALQSAAEQSAEVVRIERLSIDVGSGTQTDYLDAEANLLRVRASLIEAQHAEFAARVELARLLGDLSRDWVVRTAGPSEPAP